MRHHGIGFFTIIGVALAAAACGDATAGPSGSVSSSFEGVIAGDSASGLLSGKLTLTIETASLSVQSPASFDVMGVAASANVTGTLTLVGGATVALTGTYDNTTHALSIAGGGYTFTGTFAGGVLSGTFTTPTSGSGSFSTASKSSTSTGSVYAFCGTAVGTSGGVAGAGATLNLVVNTAAGTVSGFAIGNHDASATKLTGTLSGSTWSLTFTEKHGHPGTASGTYTATTFSGTYSIPLNDGEAGTVSGELCH